jgi:hypothetical protein
LSAGGSERQMLLFPRNIKAAGMKIIHLLEIPRENFSVHDYVFIDKEIYWDDDNKTKRLVLYNLMNKEKKSLTDTY